MNDIVFSEKGYADFIDAFIQNGYVISPLVIEILECDELYLRHDVDFSLTLAVKMAKFEHSLGITSTFFILLSSSAYNPYSLEGRKSIEHILELGHDVALHFDPTVYDADKGNIENHFLDEIERLHNLLGQEPMRLFSFHRPASISIERSRPLAGYEHTYMPKYIQEIAYSADSRGSFRYGNPLEQPFFIQKKSIQLLTHPVWWMTPDGTPYCKLLNLCELYANEYQTMIGQNCQPFREAVKK